MPLKRTPPNTPGTSQSDPDLTALEKCESHEAYITTRGKRMRAESSSPRDETSFLREEMKEMKSMIESLQKSQLSLFGKICDDVSLIKKQNIQIQQMNSDIVKGMENMRESQEKLSRRMDSMEAEKKNLVAHIEQLQTKLSDLQMSTRPAAVEIRNVAYSDKETTEDIYDHIIKIGAVIGSETQLSDVRDAYRLPAKPGKQRTIVAEFLSVAKKNNFLMTIRKYNDGRTKADKLNSSVIGITGKSCPIYVSDYIPGSGRKLFFQCREFSKNNNYKFCWTTNNKIYIRKNEHSKSIRVDSEAALAALESQ